MFVTSFLCLVAILAITIISTDASSLKGEPKPKKVSLTTGAWVSTNREKGAKYLKFNEDFTYNEFKVVRSTDENGITECLNHFTGIYNRMYAEKNPSILDLSYPYMSISTRFLLYETGKKTTDFALTVVADPPYNLTYTSIKSLPKCQPVLRATVTWVAEYPIRSERPMLTWMGPDIGLYVSSVVTRVNQNNHNGVVDDDTDYDGSGGFRDNLLTVVSETDGSTVSFLPDIYPTPMREYNRCDYPFVAASFGDIFWTSSWCGRANKLFQSNASTPSISTPGEVRGAVALSESVLFVQYSNSIVKINVTNEQILATKQGGVGSGDLAISLDRKTVYHFDGMSRIVGLDAEDLSIKHTYLVNVPSGYTVSNERGGLLEVTPTHFWIGLSRESSDDDADDDDDNGYGSLIYLARLKLPKAK